MSTAEDLRLVNPDQRRQVSEFSTANAGPCAACGGDLVRTYASSDYPDMVIRSVLIRERSMKAPQDRTRRRTISVLCPVCAIRQGFVAETYAPAERVLPAVRVAPSRDPRWSCTADGWCDADGALRSVVVRCNLRDRRTLELLAEGLPREMSAEIFSAHRHDDLPTL